MGVGAGTDGLAFARLHFVESDMADDGAGAGDLQIIEEDQRMRWHDEMNERVRPIEQMLDRMHGEAGPRAGVDGIVVHGMDPFVEDGHMDQPVDAIEVELVPQRQHEGEDNEPHRIIRERAPQTPAIGIAPQAQDLVGRPDRHSCREGADDVVDVLVLEHEHVAGIFRRPLAVELEAVGLRPLDIEAQFKRAIDDEHQQ